MKCPKCGFENAELCKCCEQCGCEMGGSQGGQAVVAQRSGMAIASFICSLLSPLTCMLSGIVGFVLGVISLVKISSSKGALKGKGFAITGIVLAFVWFIIMLIAMAALIPALEKTRDLAQQMMSGTNLRGISVAVLVYANENDDEFPTADKWCDLLIEEADVSEKQLVSPVLMYEKGPICSYALNENVVGMKVSEVPADMVVFFETASGWNQVGVSEDMKTDYYKRAGLNVLFGDGHVEFVTESQIDKLRWSVDEPAAVEE